MARKHRDRALDWITRWRQVASNETKEALRARGLDVRHKEHPDGEARVVPHRRYRFDWAVPGLKVAVEIDGGNYMTRYSKKLKRRIPVGRHTKSSDYEKRNLAAEAGWVLLCYTTEMLDKDPAACVEQVERVVQERLR
jgi:very-short-patch-repair endonuclease